MKKIKVVYTNTGQQPTKYSFESKSRDLTKMTFLIGIIMQLNDEQVDKMLKIAVEETLSDQNSQSEHK